MRLIDADALMDEVSKRYCEECEMRRGIKKGKQTIVYEIGDAPCRACSIDDMKCELETAPTIEERKKGKWVYHDDDDMRYDTYHCSSCRKLFTVDAERLDDIGFVKEDLNYCPNCGADMRGEE